MEDPALVAPLPLTLAVLVRRQRDPGGSTRAVGEQRDANTPRRPGAACVYAPPANILCFPEHAASTTNFCTCADVYTHMRLALESDNALHDARQIVDVRGAGMEDTMRVQSLLLEQLPGVPRF